MASSPVAVREMTNEDFFMDTDDSDNDDSEPDSPKPDSPQTHGEIGSLSIHDGGLDGLFDPFFF